MKNVLKLFMILCIAFAGTAAFAQDIQTKGSIGGTVTDSNGGSIAGRLAKMSAAERSAWAAEIAAQARALLEAPTIDHEDR